MSETPPLAPRPSPAPPSFTGRARRKQTPWRVQVADRVAMWSITIGGIGTIVAVSLVFAFLLAVTAPLFLPARLTRERPFSGASAGLRPVALGVDEFNTMVWELLPGGEVRLTRLDDGRKVVQRPAIEGLEVTAFSQLLATNEAAVGGSDGSVRFGTVGVTTTVLSSEESLPASARRLAAGERIAYDEGILERTTQGPWRLQKFEVSWGNPVSLGKLPLRLLDHIQLSGGDGVGSRSYLLAFQTSDGRCHIGKVEEQENQFTGEKSLVAESFALPHQPPAGVELTRILLAGRGDNVYLVWRNGLLQRFEIRDTARATLLETVPLLPAEQARVNGCCLLLGRETLVVADDQGGLRAWFRTRRSDEVAGDGQRLTMVHDLTVGQAAVGAVCPSERGRLLTAGYADGMLRVFQVTTEKLVVEQQVAAGEPIRMVAMAPREDGLFAATDRMLWAASFQPRHPEASWAALFRPVWYEGYDRPTHIWQSSFATSAPEMKLGLMPLVFGTLKATFYSMLFAVPLALFAAIYTSEFMPARARGWVKPTIEMMASLPSVVLGFLAALLFAPIVEEYVTATVGTLFLAPFFYLLAAHLWQALPQTLYVRWQRLRLALLFLPLPAGILAAWASEPWLEHWLFAGDVMRWLDGQIGSGLGAWLLLWLPVSALLVTVLLTSQVYPLLRRWTEHWSRGRCVLLNLASFLLATACTLLLAAAVSSLLDSVGWDPRGSYVGTYVQRNALVVGVVMGFAVVPIIYTIADDALSTVPQHLRSASLGCGATPWQTAMRVVVPTAMSGLFSAVIIGLGRSVGETMIVLMAGGNTPVIEWNVFNGFRTLSANIATELPEAVGGSTHYRTLFLAALTLFLLTFCLNTVAELVRARFRRRAYQL